MTKMTQETDRHSHFENSDTELTTCYIIEAETLWLKHEKQAECQLIKTTFQNGL